MPEIESPACRSGSNGEMEGRNSDRNTLTVANENCRFSLAWMLLRNLAKTSLRSGRRNGKEFGFVSHRMHKSKHCDVEHWASREEGGNRKGINKYLIRIK